MAERTDADQLAPSPSAAPSARWVRTPAALSRTTPRGLLLMGDRRHGVMLVPGIGPVLWDLLAQPIDQSALLATLADLFDVDQTTIADDVLQLLAGLARRDLIQSA